MNHQGFYQIELDLPSNLFSTLYYSVHFMETGKGRLGNHLLKADERGLPLVRTSTKYTEPACLFAPVHLELVNHINHAIRSQLGVAAQDFNNALIEVYDRQYSKMNFHSDQALDLAPQSYIALFSCYENAKQTSGLRKLSIKNKLQEETFDLQLGHHSLVLFSLEINRKFQHKIVLDTTANSKNMPLENRWLGLTFRVSNTFIQFKNGLPYFSSGELLELANEEQSLEFYTLRKAENNGVDFEYPNLYYTLSEADRLPPREKKKGNGY